MTAPVVQEATVSEKVAMTAPVVQAEGEDGGFVVAFVLPASMTLATAPSRPTPTCRCAPCPSGWPPRCGTPVAGRRASTSVTGPSCSTRWPPPASPPPGAARFARFDPPFKPWFLRRNEVVQDVVRP